MREFHSHLDRRLEAFNALKSRADCEKWQKERREFFLRQIGRLPERTPLNAKIVGELKGDGYRIEKVLFESRPGHHVTANLYLPLEKAERRKPSGKLAADSQEPGGLRRSATTVNRRYPAVLVPCGHSRNGKAAGHYQRVSSLMAKNGIAALCYDPIGQGERYQSLADSDQTHYRTAPRYEVPHPRVQFLPTIEHTTMGVGSILLGSNVAQYRIWDGTRAIDYLQSRDDIIADKIGCTGNSGGGTLTAYLMALDDRIVAAAPACYLTTFRRLIETRGAQDAEQNIFGQIAFGMDEPDYVMMRAPKPTLICAATRDVTFDIGGTWDLFRQSKRFYTRMGYAERVDMIEADARHGFTILLRTASVRFMRRWLLGKDDVIHELDPLPDPLTDEVMREHQYSADWTDKQLQCSPDGQVMLMKAERSVFDINASVERELRKQRKAVWEKLNSDQRRELVRKTIGVVEFARIPSARDGKQGILANSTTIKRDGYRIEKLVLTGNEDQLTLPGLLFVPATVSKSPVLYLHGESMKAEAQPGARCEQLVKKGHIVLSAELSGIGETETGHDKRDYGRGLFGRDSQEIFLAYLMGRSLVGMRTDDVLRWSEYLSSRVGWGSSPDPKAIDQSRPGQETQPKKIQVIATGEAAIPALHAAAVEPSHFDSVRLTGMIRSWAEVVAAPENLNQLVNAVHGALRHYDLPDLVELAGNDRVKIEESVDASGRQED